MSFSKFFIIIMLIDLTVCVLALLGVYGMKRYMAKRDAQAASLALSTKN